MGKRLVLNDFFCAKVVWQKTMMLFWFDCLCFSWFYLVSKKIFSALWASLWSKIRRRPAPRASALEFRSRRILTLSPRNRVMARWFVILSFAYVNEWILLLLFISWDFSKKKSGIFVSFPFSTLRSEKRLPYLLEECGSKPAMGIYFHQ